MDESVRRFLGQVKVISLGAFGGYLKAELLLSIEKLYPSIIITLLSKPNYFQGCLYPRWKP